MFHAVDINTLFRHSITFAHELHHFKIEMILLLQDSISQIIPQIPLFVTHFTTFFWIFVPKLRLFHVNFRFGQYFLPTHWSRVKSTVRFPRYTLYLLIKFYHLLLKLSFCCFSNSSFAFLQSLFFCQLYLLHLIFCPSFFIYGCG